MLQALMEDLMNLSTLFIVRGAGGVRPRLPAPSRRNPATYGSLPPYFVFSFFFFALG